MTNIRWLTLIMYTGVTDTEKKIVIESGKNLTRPQEIKVTIHHADSGPSLEACMISILSNHMSKSANF